MIPNIWNIVKKDWKLVRLPVTVMAVIQVAAGISTFYILPMVTGQEWLYGGLGYDLMPYVLTVLRYIALFGNALVIVALVRKDVIPGVTQDWLTRPIPRMHMLAGKVAGVLLMAHGPRFIGDWLAAIAGGYGAGHALWIALMRGVLVFLTFSLPWLACASLYSSAMEMLIVNVIFTLFFGAAESRGQFGREWLLLLTVGGLNLIAAPLALFFGYVRRNLDFAKLGLGIALLIAVFSSALPFAFVSRALEPKVIADSLAVKYDPTNEETRLRYYGNVANIPLQIVGLPEDTRMQVGLLRARIGNVEIRGRGVSPSEPAHKFEQYLSFTDEMEAQIGSASQSLELDYQITLAHRVGSESFPAAPGNYRLPGFGPCIVTAADAGALSMTCADQNRSFDCYSAQVDFPKDPSQNKDAYSCVAIFRPITLRWGLSAIPVQIHGKTFAFRDKSGAPIKMTDDRLRDGRITLTTYEATGTLRRKVVIPDFPMPTAGRPAS